MDIILKEKEIALKSIETGYIDEKKPTNTIRILIKYYYNIGMNKDQILDELESFMRKYYLDFNAVSWQNILEGMIKTYANDKQTLVNIDSIRINKLELEKIKDLNDLKLEKLSFVLLVYAKILNKINDKNNNWVNKSSSIIFKEALLKDTGKKQKLILKQLKDLEYISIPKMVNKTSLRINYINEESEDVEIEIFDFRDFVLEYLKWRGEKVDICENCSRLILQSSNHKKYCKECFEKNRLIYKAQKEKEYRENRKRGQLETYSNTLEE